MGSSAGAPIISGRKRVSWTALAGSRRLLLLASLVLLLGINGHPVKVHAETSVPPASTTITTPASSPSAAQAQPQLVFTMGTIAKVDPNAVTLRFEDGQTETYNVSSATTFQTQDGGAATFADLDVGDMAMIIAPEGSSIATVIVDAGDTGFNGGGPYDIGDNE